MSGNELTAAELKGRLADGGSLVLLDVLNEADFEEMRLPGARRASVYEMTFLDQVAKAVEAHGAEIVVYGSSESSRDSIDAVEKLTRAGYTNVARFPGGRAGWQAAGYDCEGSAAHGPWDPRPAAPLEDGSYAVDPEESALEWAGRNIGSKHGGTIRASGGSLRIEGERLAGGALDVDMRTIEVGDLTGEMAGFLKTHLESDDFFDTERHPSAKLEIVEATPRDAAAGQPNYDIRAAFTLLGVTKEISFPAVLAPHKPETVALQAYFPIDRTEWGVNYGSGKLYERLGMHLVNDEINLDVKIVAQR